MKWFDIADELLPPIYRAIKDMYAYAKAVNGELLSWVSYMERILNNYFVQTCDTSTLVYWENLLQIQYNGESDAVRRENILSLLNNLNPTTEPYVRSVIEKTFVGDEYNLWFDVENDKPYDLNIDIFTTDEVKLQEFKDWFIKMCPAHLRHVIARAERADFDSRVFISYANLSATWASLGLVQRAVVPPSITGVFGGDESRLFASGSMNKSNIAYDNKVMTDSFVDNGGTVEVWKSSYVPHVVVFPESTGETDKQKLNGTIRRFGIKANRDIGFNVAGSVMNASYIRSDAGGFRPGIYVVGGRLEQWHSSYSEHPISFPDATGVESPVQMVGGTFRRWGAKANRGIELIDVMGTSMVLFGHSMTDISFEGNNTVHGECLEVYNKNYTPIVITFPEKGAEESSEQMVSGTLRISGTKANRGIALNGTFGSFHME